MFSMKKIIINAREKYADEDSQRKAQARKKYIEGEEALQYSRPSSTYPSQNLRIM